MSTRANWFLDLEIPAADLDEPPEPLVSELADRIDLRDPESLHREVSSLLARENTLWSAGVRCAIKQEGREGSSICSACPLRRTEPDDALTPLCNVGVEQERVMTLLAIHRHARPG